MEVKLFNLVVLNRWTFFLPQEGPMTILLSYLWANIFKQKMFENPACLGEPFLQSPCRCLHFYLFIFPWAFLHGRKTVHQNWHEVCILEAFFPPALLLVLSWCRIAQVLKICMQKVLLIMILHFSSLLVGHRYCTSERSFCKRHKLHDK